MNQKARLSRRRILTSVVASGLALALNDATAQEALSPTPACHDDDAPTVPQIEGPFFKPKSPPRSDLRQPGLGGLPVKLSGQVLTRSCRPIGGALVDLWHADGNGVYDNTGFRLRGHVLTDAEGRYQFSTIMPGRYPGRTRHYHIKARAPGSTVLTTQFYFPNEPENRLDALFRRELLMRVAAAEDGLLARFDIVLALS